MSKIGRKPIDIKDTHISISGSDISIKGSKWTGTYHVPAVFDLKLEGKKLYITPHDKKEVSRDVKVLWGMHRALLANKIAGAHNLFEKQLQINGLGFKALLSGKKLELSLGFSHKNSYELPANVSVEIDKTGQLLTFKSSDKELLGAVCDHIRAMRPPEPYKGTGIRLVTEIVRRKAGKAKAAGAA